MTRRYRIHAIRAIDPHDRESIEAAISTPSGGGGRRIMMTDISSVRAAAILP